MKAIFSIIISAFLIMAPKESIAKPVCIETEGEGLIVRGDIPSARVEAVNRAKWAAVEQVAGVEVNSRTIVNSSELIDDIISTKSRGIVANHRLIKEQKSSDGIKVRVNVCVEPSQARDTISPLALNSAVAVFVPSRVLSDQSGQRFTDTTSFSESMNNALINRGFTVRDLAAGGGVKGADLDNALKSGNFIALRSMAYRYNSNTILIGHIEPSISVKRGDDAGYGIKTPFSKVTARLVYRLLTRDGNGEPTILAAGSEEGYGIAPSPEDAHAAALKNLAELAVPRIMEKIEQRMKDIANRINVTFEGTKSVEETFALRDILQKLTWVSSVDDLGLGRFNATYPENPLYLANSLSQRGFRIIEYSKGNIRVQRR